MSEAAPRQGEPQPTTHGDGEQPRPDERSQDRRAPPRKPFYKRPIPMLLLGLVVVAAVVLGVMYYLNSRHWESTDDAFIDGAVVQVSPKVAGRVAAVNVTDNQAVSAGDVLVRIDDRDFAAELKQQQAARGAAEGRAAAAQANLDQVKVTAPSDVRAASAGVDQAKAGLETAHAAVGAAQSQVEQAAARIKAAEAAVDQAVAELAAAQAEQERTKQDLERRQSLANTGAVGQQELTNVRAAARAASAQVDASNKKVAAARAAVAEAQAGQFSAQQLLREAQAGVGAAAAQVKTSQEKLAQAKVAPQRIAAVEGDLRTAQAEVQRLKALVSQAELNLSYTRIIAPIDGRVTRKAVEVGDYLQLGQAVFALVPRELWVTADFKETQLANIRPGQSVNIRIDAYRGQTFPGHVDSIQLGSGAAFSLLPPENATGNYVKVVQRVPVKIVFDKPVPPQFPIGPGMSVVPEVRIR